MPVEPVEQQGSEYPLNPVARSPGPVAGKSPPHRECSDFCVSPDLINFFGKESTNCGIDRSKFVGMNSSAFSKPIIPQYLD